MARDPQRRYLSCRAFAEDLESFADGRSVAARPVGFGERLGRPLRRHRGAVVGLTATGGLLLGSGATRAREVLEEALKIADHPRAESAERTTLATNYQLARDPVRSRAEMIKAA